MVNRKRKLQQDPNLHDELILDQTDHALASRAPKLDIQTDSRLQIFTGRKVNIDYESSTLLEVKPQALQNELQFRLKSQDLLLDPTDIWVKIRARIMLIDENGSVSPIPPPERLRKLVETERVVETESPPVVPNGKKIIKTKKETIDKETEILDGIG